MKISLDNLYHELCHRYLYADREENIAALQGSYKSVFFLLQNLMYLRTGEFVKTRRDLSPPIVRRGEDGDGLGTKTES